MPKDVERTRAVGWSSTATRWTPGSASPWGACPFPATLAHLQQAHAVAEPNSPGGGRAPPGRHLRGRSPSVRQRGTTSTPSTLRISWRALSKSPASWCRYIRWSARMSRTEPSWMRREHSLSSSSAPASDFRADPASRMATSRAVHKSRARTSSVSSRGAPWRSTRGASPRRGSQSSLSLMRYFLYLRGRHTSNGHDC